MGRILGWFILLGVIGYIAYLGMNLIRIRLKYSDIKDKAETMLNPFSPVRFDKIPDELMEHAKKREIPLKKENIRLIIDEWKGYKVLSFKYNDSLMLFNWKPIYFRYSFTDTVPLRR